MFQIKVDFTDILTTFKKYCCLLKTQLLSTLTCANARNTGMNLLNSPKPLY